MKKSIKKLMALAMAGVMMCSPIMASAATVTEATTYSIEGEGSVDVVKDLDVFTVILPTDTEYEGKSPYNFTLDPQRLMFRSGRADKDYTFWFANGSNTSEALEVKSKSTIDVDVAISVTMDGLGEGSPAIVMTGDDTFTDDTSTSLYMAVNLAGDITDEEKGTTPIESGKKEVEVPCTLSAIDAETNVKLVYDEDGGYRYEYVGNDVKKVSFSLTGACNDSKDADWVAVSEAESVKPKMTVAWSVAPHGGIQEYKITDTVVINYTGDTPAITAISMVGPGGASANLAQANVTNKQVTLVAGTLTMNPTYLSLLSTSSGYGYGIYTITINSTQYKFKLVE